LNGITSVAIHIGISDIIADFIYKDFGQILDTISDIKKYRAWRGSMVRRNMFSAIESNKYFIIV
jgi:hypothetical protein